MRNIKSVLKLFSVFLLLLISNQANAQTKSEIKELTVEANHSTIQFAIPISNGITRVTGKFTDYSIDLMLVDDDLTKSSISTFIQAKSINTGIEARDDHLRTADFFDVEKYPEITFISNRIESNSDGYLIHGKFTMHGVSKDMSFVLKPTGKVGENTYAFSARFTLNRIDYGVGADFKHTSEENFLGEEIAVEIDFWTKKKKKKKQD